MDPIKKICIGANKDEECLVGFFLFHVWDLCHFFVVQKVHEDFILFWLLNRSGYYVYAFDIVSIQAY